MASQTVDRTWLDILTEVVGILWEFGVTSEDGTLSFRDGVHNHAGNLGRIIGGVADIVIGVGFGWTGIGAKLVVVGFD